MLSFSWFHPPYDHLAGLDRPVKLLLCSKRLSFFLLNETDQPSRLKRENGRPSQQNAGQSQPVIGCLPPKILSVVSFFLSHVLY
ncbi:hypothetical protein CLOSTMETH_00921 [[Clostridium] methylpentosum DSM 5476]|uniref:Uncharacterized protein n=1 Tax=[Clostridium] methylpentosum DSM 5476 TaxID=537013 RepID=C0EAQ6_9FIRM|nr:hypothetical protein CLOSTMETH_00921 [[Clostridium] methylpentosum DSM 5476]